MNDKNVKFLYGTDGIDVKLIDFSEHPCRVIAQMTAATVANTDGLNLGNMRGRLTTEITRGVLEGKALPIGLESVKYTFAIENISRNCTHQLVRTRVGAGFSQQSQRAVALKPPLVFRIPKGLSLYQEAMLKESCEKAENYYQLMLKEKVSPEDARFVLPSAICTHIVATYNLVSLKGVLRGRLCYGAQWEIRNVAKKMLNEVKRVHSFIAEYLDLPCKKAKRCFHPQKENHIIQECPIMQSFKKEKNEINIQK